MTLNARECWGNFPVLYTAGSKKSPFKAAKKVLKKAEKDGAVDIFAMNFYFMEDEGIFWSDLVVEEGTIYE